MSITEDFTTITTKRKRSDDAQGDTDVPWVSKKKMRFEDMKPIDSKSKTHTPTHERRSNKHKNKTKKSEGRTKSSGARLHKKEEDTDENSIDLLSDTDDLIKKVPYSDEKEKTTGVSLGI